MRNKKNTRYTSHPSVQCFTSFRVSCSIYISHPSVQCFTSLRLSLSNIHFTPHCTVFHIVAIILVQYTFHTPVYSVSLRCDYPCPIYISHPSVQCFTSFRLSFANIHFTPRCTVFHLVPSILVHYTFHTLVYSVSPRSGYSCPISISHPIVQCFISWRLPLSNIRFNPSVQCFTSLRLSLSNIHFTTQYTVFHIVLIILVRHTFHTPVYSVSHRSDYPCPIYMSHPSVQCFTSFRVFLVQ